MTIQPTDLPVWRDGDPLMEAIAAAVYQHCEVQHGSGGIVTDDPRNIAAAAVAGIRDAARTAARQTTGQADTELDPAVVEAERVCALPDWAGCSCSHLTGCEHPHPAVGQPAEAQDADEARSRAYDNLYAELTRGVTHAQIRHHLIAEHRAAVLREAADAIEADTAHIRYGSATEYAMRHADLLRRLAAGAES